MNLALLLDMAAAANPERTAVKEGGGTITYQGLLAAAGAGAELFAGAGCVAYLGPNHIAFPVSLFGAAFAGVPFLPLNYRLPGDQLASLVAQHHAVLVGADDAPEVAAAAETRLSRDELVRAASEPKTTPPTELPTDADGTALLLYTSGTTAAPSAAILRHRHLVAYIIESVEFASAAENEATLVSVPPYHVAGVASLLSNLYAGRRIVYLDQFDPVVWLDTVRAEGVTQAMLVPTMLARIVDTIGDAMAGTPTLRALSYGGARTPAPVLERAMRAFPSTGFTNAYGLTETSSTIAVLGPDDHRAAIDTDDPLARARLASAGRLLPGIEVQVRGEDGSSLPTGTAGDVWVRGEQVSGEYVGISPALDRDGWFPTRDRGWVDREGYLFIEGRTDDTIIRGGENIAPAEIEEVLLAHPEVAQCAVVGLPDEEWGQRIAAVVVRRQESSIGADEIREWAGARLRGSRTPDQVEFRADLPHTDTGKLLRRVLVAELTAT